IGETVNDGVFSWWKGQSPLKSFPVFFRRTYSPTTRTMSACCFTRSANDPASANATSSFRPSLRKRPESHSHLSKVFVAGQNLYDPQIGHDHHAAQVRKRN